MRVIYTSKGMSKKFGVRVIYRKIRYFITRGNYIGYMFRLWINHLQAYFCHLSHKMLGTLWDPTVFTSMDVQHLVLYYVYKHIVMLPFKNIMLYRCLNSKDSSKNRDIKGWLSLLGGKPSLPKLFLYYFVFWTMTNKYTIIWQIITLLPHVSTLLCQPQGVRG